MVGKKTGRPKKPINWDMFKKMCGILCTEEEIASMLDISVDTLERRCKSELKMTFAEAFKKYSANGKMSIRRAQFQLAVNKQSATMLIWLGKQYLGQKDQQEVSVNSVDDETVRAMDEYFKKRNPRTD